MRKEENRMALERPYNPYQYETSPRKLKPKNTPAKKPKTTKPSTAKKNAVAKEAKEKVSKFKIVVYVLIGFAVLFTISYRNSQINESFSKNQKLKKEYTELQKENEQLNIGIQNSLNLNQLEEAAKTMLGMQKLSNKQKVFVSLPKRDYIEVGAEEIVIEEDGNFLTRIFENFKNIF